MYSLLSSFSIAYRAAGLIMLVLECLALILAVTLSASAESIQTLSLLTGGTFFVWVAGYGIAYAATHEIRVY